MAPENGGREVTRVRERDVEEKIEGQKVQEVGKRGEREKI